MLFDPRPKKSRKEIYDREKELEALDAHAGKCTPLVLVLGIRRIGKTSLLRAFLEEWPGVYIDLRGANTLPSLYARLSNGLTGHLWRIRSIIRGIRGITVHGELVSVKWRGTNSIDLVGLLEEVNSRARECFVLVLDEAQSTRPPISALLKRAIAYAYDNLDRIMIVVSGSEVGLLHDFIGVENPESLLYGRYHATLTLERFTPEMSRDFLRRGFAEEGFPAGEDIIEEGVRLFDGIVGWLVFYGRTVIDRGYAPEAVYEAAVGIALEGLQRLRPRERAALRAVAEGCQSWSCVRDYASTRLGVAFPKASLTRAIRKLEKLSLIRDYQFLDPVYREAARRLRV